MTSRQTSGVVSDEHLRELAWQARAERARRNHRTMKTLADSLQDEIRRVRDDVLPAYLECGPGGAFAVAGMRADMDAAVKALAEHDGVECLRSYEILKGWKQ